MEGKPRYKSKTYGFGTALLVLALAVLALPELRGVVETLPGEYQAGALFAIGVATLGLRELTKGPVGEVAEKGIRGAGDPGGEEDDGERDHGSGIRCHQ